MHQIGVLETPVQKFATELSSVRKHACGWLTTNIICPRFVIDLQAESAMGHPVKLVGKEDTECLLFIKAK